MYSGAIENGQMHGPGRLQYANGDVFEVGETELHVVDGDLPALVRERVALLAVDR